MAQQQQRSLTDLDKMSCFICSEQLRDPAKIPCGHCFCLGCISKHWDKVPKGSRAYSCPLCHTTFLKPVMEKNTALAYLVEKQKRSPASSPHQHDAGLQPLTPAQSTVDCDFCTVRKRRASKSCLQCLVSYCDDHLKPHHDVPALKRHKLTEPVDNLQENICSQHNDLKRLFCIKCQQCICSICQLGNHKGHIMAPAEDMIKVKKKDMQVLQQKVQWKVQGIEKNIDLLQKELQAINESADKVVRKNKETQETLQQNSMKLTNTIRRQQKIEVTRVQDLLQKLRQELDSENNQKSDLEQVTHIRNYTEFIIKSSSISAKMRNLNTSNITEIPGPSAPLKYFDEASKAVTDLNYNCMRRFHNLSAKVTEVDVLLPQNPQSTAEFSQYLVKLRLSPKGANKSILFSEENAKVILEKDWHGLPPSPVLSMTALLPRCYWEVEWTGPSVSVGVAYKDIEKKGPECMLGCNDISWVLECWNKKNYVYRHNGSSTDLSPCESSRVGVFLDHRAGILCFYQVSKTYKLIHKVETTFTQPLYAGLGLFHCNVSAEMCNKAKELEEEQEAREIGAPDISES